MTRGRRAKRRWPWDRRRERPNYDRVFAKVEARIGEHHAWVLQHSRLGLQLSETLLQLPDREAREKRVRELARFQPWSVAFAVLGGARQQLEGEPADAAILAELAVAVAEAMDTTAQPLFLKLGLLVHAYLLLAESRNRAGEIEEAEAALERAETYLAETCREPRSRFFRLLRHLRRMQASFDGAHQRLASLLTILEERLEEDFDV